MAYAWTYHVEDDLDLETAARTRSNVPAIEQFVERYLELVATRARVGVKGRGFVEGHVLDLYLVVE